MKLHGQARGICLLRSNPAGLPVERNPAPKTIHPWITPWFSGAWTNSVNSQVYANLFFIVFVSLIGLYIFIPKVVSADYQFIPTAGNIVTGTNQIINATLAPTAETSLGSYKALLADDTRYWGATSTASGIDMQVTLGNVALNGANKLIIQTDLDIDATVPNLLIQICDWTSATNVDNQANGQCTGGGWRTLNSRNAVNFPVYYTSATGATLQWHVYDGYFATTSAAGGVPISTPLSNFVNGSNQTLIRYFATTSVTSVVAVDFLRMFAVVDPIYQASGFTNLGSGVPTGTYHNTIAIGNSATAQTIQTGDAVNLSVPGTAGTISDFYLSFGNIKTYTGMNTILVNTDALCSAATLNLNYTFAVRNFTTSAWEDITGPVDCSVTAVVRTFAKNNMANISDYISGGEVRIRVYGSINSTTNIQLDTMYVILGTTNSGANDFEVSFGTTTAGRLHIDPSTGSDQINAMASDGTYMYLAGLDSFGIDNRWRLEKRNLSDGALVSTFGTGGVVVSDPSINSDQILAIATTSDAVFIAGFDSIVSTTDSAWRVEKYDITTGAPVTAFGLNGVLRSNPSARLDRIRGIAADATDIYIVGDDLAVSTTNGRWRIQKHNIVTGATTTAFDTDGIVTYDPSVALDTPYAIKLDGAGNIFVAGSASTTLNGIGWNIQKISASDGSLVTAFSGDGILNDTNPSAVTDEALALALNGTDIFVTGYDGVQGGASPQQWRTQKYNITTGATTTAFGVNGAVTFNNTTTADNDQAKAIAINSTDVYVAGFDDDDAGRARIYKYDIVTGATSTDSFGRAGTVMSEDGGDDRFNAIFLNGNYLYVGGYGTGPGNNQWIVEKREKSSGLLATTTFPAITGVAATRDIDTTATSTNVWSIQSEDETTNMSHDFYSMDNGASNSTVEEATSANINFSVTAPTNAAITSAMFAGRYMSGAGGSAQLTIRDYSGLSNTLAGTTEGGWSLIGAASTIAQVYTDPVTVGTVALGGIHGYISNADDYIDLVGNKMNLRLPTTVGSASTTNTTMMWDFAFVSLQWAEDANRPSRRSQFIPTAGNIVTGTNQIINATLAPTAETSLGSYKALLADDTRYWGATSTASGIDMQVTLGNVALNGANKLIIQTDLDIDATVPNLLIQICDWTSATNVDNQANGQCTGGGWRTLNSRNAVNFPVYYTSATGATLQWHVYDGYFATTSAAGGVPISTPLSNFVNGSNQTLIRYFATTSVTSVVAVDFLRMFAVVDPIYQASGFTNLGSGVPTGTYHNTIAIGNSATAQTIQTGDAVNLSVPGTAGTISDFYLSFGNIKTYTGMNTILVNTDALCSAATLNLNYTFAVRNFTTSAWEDITGPVDCSVTAVVRTFAKNNMANISDYISGGEVRIRVYGSINSTTNIQLDTMYVILGTTNSGANDFEVSFGTTTAGRLHIDPSTGSDQINAMASDGTYMYLAGLDSFGIDNRWRLEKRNLSDGALVSTFGTGGVVVSDPSINSDQILAIATTSDAVFIAGFDSIVSTTDSAWRVEKYDITTGAPVTAFGLNGVLRSNPSARLDRIRGIAADATDIYIVGDDLAVSTTNGRWRIQKHNIVTGATTTAFDTDGIVTYDPSVALDTPYAIKLDGAGNIFVAGSASTTLNGIGWNIQKISASDGSLVTAFSGDGILNDTNPSAVTDEALALALNGTDIFVTGYDGVQGGASPQQWRTQKYNITTGATTTAFGVNGAVTFNNTTTADNDQAKAIAINSTDVYVAGFDDDDAGRARIYKYDIVTGATSTDSFGRAGTVMSEDGGDDRFNAIFLNGNYLYVGGYGTGPGNNQWIVEKREKSSGLLATTTFPAITGVAATRDIDTTATSTNVWSIQSEDETTNMSHDFYSMDNGASNSTVEEATSANINFSVTAPTNAAITSAMFAGRYMSGAGGSAQLTIRDYSGLSNTLAGTTEGGWSLIGAASTIAQVYTDPVTVGTVALGGIHGYISNADDYIDLVGNKMNLRLPTTVGSASTTNTTKMWDFAMSSLQWVETGAPGTPTLTQAYYRWRDDNGGETGASFAVATDTPLTSNVYIGDRRRLRFLLSNTGNGTATGYTYRLEHASTSCTTWLPVPASATTEHWQMDASGNMLDNTATTDFFPGITNPSGKTFVAGAVKTTGNQTDAITLSSTQFTELEYSIRSTSLVTSGTTYCFRLTNAGSITNFAYTVQPQISVQPISNRPTGGGEGSEPGGGGSPVSGGGAGGGGGGEPEGGGSPQGGGNPDGGGGDSGYLYSKSNLAAVFETRFSGSISNIIIAITRLLFR